MGWTGRRRHSQIGSPYFLDIASRLKDVALLWWLVGRPLSSDDDIGKLYVREKGERQGERERKGERWEIHREGTKLF